MSNIDPTVPVYGSPTTQSVRDNFAAAKTEIEALQTSATGAPFLPLAGGTLTGLLTLSGPPTTTLHAATKAYVDLRLLLSGGVMSGNLVLNADPIANLQAATKQYVDAAATVANAAVKRAGDTMTGLLTLSGPPTANLHAATKQYVDGQLSGIGAGVYLPLTGGALTGPLTLSGPPSTGLHAATKTYVDTQIAGIGSGAYLPLSGGTLTGPLVLPADPGAALQAATKQYVDAKSALASSAVPAMDGTGAAGTGTTWARGDHVHPSDTSRLALVGGTMTGLLTLSADPYNPLHAATKQYVDSHASTGGPYLPISGGTITGGLTVLSGMTAATVGAGTLFVQQGAGNGLTVSVSNNSTDPIQFSGSGSGGVVFNEPVFLVTDPTTPLGVATKQYVDAHAGGGTPACIGALLGNGPAGAPVAVTLGAGMSMASSTLNAWATAVLWGVGSDGAVTISTAVTTGRVMQDLNLTLAAGGALRATFPVQVNGTLDLTNAGVGAIYSVSGNTGGNATGATGGAGSAPGSNTYFPRSGSGSNGATGVTGVGVVAVATPAAGAVLGRGGGKGGVGGAGGAGAGGAGVSGQAATSLLTQPDMLWNYLYYGAGVVDVAIGACAGTGGSSGAGDGTNTGGGGGGGGSGGVNPVHLNARVVVTGGSTPAGVISTYGGDGGNGGNGAGGNAGGGGGGGGGGSCPIRMNYESRIGSTVTGAIQSQGGKGGNGGNGTGTGVGGGGGGSGTGGSIFLFNLGSQQASATTPSFNNNGSNGSGNAGGAGATSTVLSANL